MDFSGFGSMMQQPQGGIMGGLQRLLSPAAAQAAPVVPADGGMQPTIGPGVAPSVQPQAKPAGMKFGLPAGGILGLLQGQSPQGLAGILKGSGLMGSPLGGGMPQAGMLPGSPMIGPVAPPVQLPQNINPMDQY